MFGSPPSSSSTSPLRPRDIPARQVSTGTSEKLNNVSIDASFGFIRYDTTNHNLEVYEQNGWKDIVINDKPAIDISGKLVVDGDVSFNAHLSAVDASFQNNVDISGNLSITSTGALTLPVGTTDQQPTTGVKGMVRFNSSSTRLQFYNGNAWRSIETNIASGGAVTEHESYRIHTFTISDTFTVSIGCDVSYLIVAGGGGGAGRDVGGGGGAGGMRTGSTQLNAGSYIVTVGGGGGGSFDSQNPITTANKGSDSSFNSIVCKGGGAGWNHVHPAASDEYFHGGSGGGGAGITNYTGGSGASGEGYGGGSGSGMSTSFYGGGGGGGAGEIGKTAIEWRHGGDGILSDITGTNIYYAGGGGGAGHRSAQNQTLGTGGKGGGGNAGDTSTSGDGTDGLGGGGGASKGADDRYVSGVYTNRNVFVGGSGGDGIVIIRYLI